jgi:hypothetical protein
MISCKKYRGLVLELSIKYNVSRVMMSGIVNNKHWKNGNI